MRKSALTGLGVLIAAVAGGAPALAQCPLDWADGFAAPGLSGEAYALAVFDDGTGPALYVGGDFETAGEVEAENLARWDGQKWSAVPGRLNGWVYALAVYDDGTGPALYVGGTFSMAGGVPAWNIARWDGGHWSALGDGVLGWVHSLAVFDDGTGPALYVGGEFEKAGGVTVHSIARWDGFSWSALGSGLYVWPPEPQVNALAVYDDGSGPGLYVGGNFWKAGGVPASCIARWDGWNWSGVGSGVGGGWSEGVSALAVYDDGAGPALYAGGDFTYVGGVVANQVACWDGQQWSALDAGTDGDVLALAAYDDGRGPALYAGGAFTTAGEVKANCIARWDGTDWSALADGVAGWVRALAAFDPPRADAGPGLYIAGSFHAAGNVGVHRIARWDGASFAPLGSGNGMSGEVDAFAVFDDGTGPALYAGGAFGAAGPVAASAIARWDGAGWSAVGGGVDGGINALAVFDDGTGPALYAAGGFRTAGGVTVNSIAKWDGTTWWPLGTGMNFPGGAVFALCGYDDGSGPALYAGGAFTKAGGIPVNRIAKWDGSHWSALGTGLTGPTQPGVYALAVFDDGSGPALYAGGIFTKAGGAPASYIARWDGSSWSSVGGGMNSAVTALGVFDNGAGLALYAGGAFTLAGGVNAMCIAKWDGQVWSALAGGTNGPVDALTLFDDGAGPALYAGGLFATAGGITVHSIAKWDGTCWRSLGAGVRALSWSVRTLGVWNETTDGRLWAGGGFGGAGARVSAHVASWGCVPNLVLGDTNCDGRLDHLDIDPFVLALCQPTAYKAAFPNCNIVTADVNRDGFANSFDIDPFVDLLLP